MIVAMHSTCLSLVLTLGENGPVALISVLVVIAAVVWFFRFLKKIEIASQIKSFQRDVPIEDHISTVVTRKELVLDSAEAIRREREALPTRDSLRAALREKL